MAGAARRTPSSWSDDYVNSRQGFGCPTLHVGTGNARLMLTTVETCNGPRAYVGLASSYGEVIEENWTRLNDVEWKDRIAQQRFPDPTWMSDVLAAP